MPRAMGLRVGGVVMPSELSGADGQAPVDLGTYKLSWPELARYRGEELDMSHGTAELLYSRFAAGDGQTTADRKRLAAELGKHRTTVDYHFEQWQTKGCPTQAVVFDGGTTAAGTEQQPTEQLQASPAAVFDPTAAEPEIEQPVAAPIEPEPAPVAASADDDTVDPAEDPEPDPVPHVPELTATVLDRVAAAVTAMGAAFVKAGLVHEIPEAVAEGLPEVGAIYEGVVVRVDPGYVLIRIVDVRDARGRHPIGKVNRYQTAERAPKSCVDLGWAEGDLVNVKVLSVNRDPQRDKLFIDLSIKQAPPHPHGPTGRNRELAAGPTVARGADIAAEMQGGVTGEMDPAAAEIIRLKAELEETQASLLRQLQSEAERERLTRGLCASCLFRVSGWCDYLEALPQTFEIPETHLREEHKGRRIVFGQAPITSCDLYRKVGTA